jgi:hypothetical protein
MTASTRTPRSTTYDCSVAKRAVTISWTDVSLPGKVAPPARAQFGCSYSPACGYMLGQQGCPMKPAQ